ncbi:MAG TPA: PadR family transcriptional regulator [Candidatus Agathobaculum pullicola]|nr:PadR family transcriptional regulator [Candidatus Agathobaculum pullicola]
MIPSQLLKGTLEGCILAILSRAPTYGYGITEQLSAYGFGQIVEGTIYPLLLRLEKNGLAQAEYRASEVGPKRKYYALTEKGRAQLQGFLASYRELTQAVDKLLADTGEDNDEQTHQIAAAGK